MHLQLHGGDGAGGASNVPHRPQSHTTNDPARSKVSLDIAAAFKGRLIGSQGEYNIAAALKGRLIGSWGGDIYVFPPICVFFVFCETNKYIVRFLRIHPVQSVINNPTQLSGRGFPRIFNMKLFLSQLYIFWYFKMEARLCNSKI